MRSAAYWDECRFGRFPPHRALSHPSNRLRIERKGEGDWLVSRVIGGTTPLPDPLPARVEGIGGVATHRGLSLWDAHPPHADERPR